jgi:hypothetical protein
LLVLVVGTVAAVSAYASGQPIGRRLQPAGLGPSPWNDSWNETPSPKDALDDLDPAGVTTGRSRRR